MPNVIALWTCPRSVSTAFEVMMIERGDQRVFHEPYGPSYYFSSDRSSDRKSHTPDQPDQTYDAVTARLMAASTETPVFFKDMAYYVKPILDAAFLSQFKSTILIRNPARLLVSLYKALPDFTLEETGYPDLHRVFQLVQDSTGAPPVILDAGDLLADPPRMVEAYCSAVGLPYKPEALSWEARDRPELNWWEGGSWHGAVSKSVGFVASTAEQAPPPDLSGMDSRVTEALEICTPLYQEMYAHRLR